MVAYKAHNLSGGVQFSLPQHIFYQVGVHDGPVSSRIYLRVMVKAGEVNALVGTVMLMPAVS